MGWAKEPLKGLKIGRLGDFSFWLLGFLILAVKLYLLTLNSPRVYAIEYLCNEW